jgi:hypothetical protein
MDQSNLKVLPQEIRDMVYEDLFEGDFFEMSLLPLQICGEMRVAATQALVRKRKTAVLNANNHTFSALTALNYIQRQVLVQRFQAIPPQMISDRLTFELQHDCRLITSISNHNSTRVTSAQFTRDTRTVAAIVSPCKLTISVNFTFHSLSVTPSSNPYHMADPGQLWTACRRDEPLTHQACEQVVFKISATDKIEAQKAVDETFAEKCRQFEAHRAHKMCIVSLSIDKALESLATARDMMTDMVNLL